MAFGIDPAEGVEPVLEESTATFLGKIVIEEKDQAIDQAKKETAGLILWCDGFKIDEDETGAAVVWSQCGQ